MSVEQARRRYVVVEPPSGEPVWLEGEPGWHGWVVIVAYCVVVPMGVVAALLWLAFWG